MYVMFLLNFILCFEQINNIKQIKRCIVTCMLLGAREEDVQNSREFDSDRSRHDSCKSSVTSLLVHFD